MVRQVIHTRLVRGVSHPALTVHDFVRVELPFGAVVGAFTHFVSPELLGGLVLAAWESERSEAFRVAGATEPSEQPAVGVILGAARSRRDALVIPIQWASVSAAWIPPLHADLELVGFGPSRTHLHVLGRSELRPGVAPGSDGASLEHRLTVALVRHVLMSLADVLSDRAET